MKYIRTKNGIYEVVKNELGECIKIDGGFVMLEDVRLIEQNIRESNTIAELIDAYVFVSKSGETHYVYFKSYDMGVCLGSRIDNDEKFKNHLLENGTVYGAIWTDKGLIYVAKMNEKGELCLI